MVKIETTHQASIRFHLNYDELVVDDDQDDDTVTGGKVIEDLVEFARDLSDQTTGLNVTVTPGVVFEPSMISISSSSRKEVMDTSRVVMRYLSANRYLKV